METIQVSELVLGCGNSKKYKKLYLPDQGREYKNPVFLDIDPRCKPDVTHDLNNPHLPFDNNRFTEIHAYEILEHVGSQGDWRFFFTQFAEFYRVLVPEGLMFISIPHGNGKFAFADPGHTRALSPGVFYFLSQEMYEQEVGKTAMTDYRHYWKGDFKIRYMTTDKDEILWVCLQKPG